MSLTAGSRLGPYEVLAAIGAGGMGQVYRARDTKLGRDVALKILPPVVAGDPDRVARFEREAKTLAALNHANIAQIHDAGQDGQHAYLVMELVEGDDLSALIARGPMALGEALPIARQITDAIEAAHDLGIIHRDLKPQNIKVKADGTVKVLDFGLAKIGEVTEGDGGTERRNTENSPTLTARATQMGMIIGTAAYMAPEQARGRAVDRRADIWAFGVVLYEMLTGRRAFEGEDISITLAGVLKEDVKWDELPADLPASVRRLIRRCLEKDPRRRLSAIGDARLELDEASAPPEPLTLGATRSGIGRTERWMWAGVAGIALTTAAALAWGSRSAPSLTPAVARFAILPPGEGQFSGSAPRISISPDGRMVVFASTAANGTDQLWLRKLDDPEVAAIPGTESGPNGLQPQSPFWSPDSRHLAFFLNSDIGAQGETRLRIVDLSTGNVRPVHALPSNNPGGAWNADGAILVSSQGTSGIQRIAATGGTPTPVTTLDEARGEIAHLWPQFLPDGRHFIYIAQTKDRANWAVVAGSIDSTDRQQLVLAEYARFAPPNLLLYVREQNLLAQVMDLRTRRLTGEPMPVATGIATMPTNGRAAFAVSDTGVLVYGSNLESQQSSGFPERHLTWLDRAGKPVGTVATSTTATRVRLSRDMTSVALVEPMLGAAGGSVWVANLQRAVKAPLTPPGIRAISPTWSFDNARLLFGSAGEGSRLTMTERAASGATAAKVVYEQPQHNVFPFDESADGRWVVFASGRENRRALIALSRSDGKTVPYLTGDYDYPQASLSPDGKWLAYVSNESGTYQVTVQPFPDPSKGKWPISTSGGSNPRWRQDGRELYFTDDEHRLFAVPVATGPAFTPGRAEPLFALPRTGQQRVPVGAAYSYDVAPGGQRFLASLPKGASQAFPLTVVTNWTSLLAPANAQR